MRVSRLTILRLRPYLISNSFNIGKTIASQTILRCESAYTLYKKLQHAYTEP